MSKLYTCKICGKDKQPNEFYLRKNGLVGEFKCKCCIKEKRKQHCNDNYQKVRECNRKAVSEFQKRNPDKNCAKASAYKAKKLQAMPSWLSQEHRNDIKSIYKYCRKTTEKTGNRHEVDHIVPLNSDIVCGLHVPWNLRIISADDNRRKSNLLIEDIVCSSEKFEELTD